jgi:hypothetical protein
VTLSLRVGSALEVESRLVVPYRGKAFSEWAVRTERAGSQIGMAERRCRSLVTDGHSGRVAHLYGQLLAKRRQGGLDFLCLGSMLGIQHAANHPFTHPRRRARWELLNCSSRIAR